MFRWGARVCCADSVKSSIDIQADRQLGRMPTKLSSLRTVTKRSQGRGRNESRASGSRSRFPLLLAIDRIAEPAKDSPVSQEKCCSYKILLLREPAQTTSLNRHQRMFLLHFAISALKLLGLVKSTGISHEVPRDSPQCCGAR